MERGEIARVRQEEQGYIEHQFVDAFPRLQEERRYSFGGKPCSGTGRFRGSPWVATGTGIGAARIPGDTKTQ